MKLDKIDIRILEAVKRISGCQVNEVLSLLGGVRSGTQLRARLNALDVQGCVFLDRQSEAGKVFVSITPFGMETLEEGRKEPATSKEMTVL